MILLVDREGPDQTAHSCSLIWAFAVCIRMKALFHMARFIYTKLNKNISVVYLKPIVRQNLETFNCLVLVPADI